MAIGAPWLRGSGKSQTRRPPSTALTQQKLRGFEPQFNVACLTPALILLGVMFVGFGVMLTVVNRSVGELVLDYTDCADANGVPCAQLVPLPHSSSAACFCSVNFTLHRPFIGQVYLYYGLTNFFQNHRLFVKSRANYQLLGRSMQGLPLLECRPFNVVPNSSLQIAPCGAVANSMFNDTVRLFYSSGGDGEMEIALRRRGLAWKSDHERRFANPPMPAGGNSSLADAFKDTAAPPFWPRPVYELDPLDADNNGYANEDLQVWMSAAALSNFRKLWRIVDHLNASATSAAFKSGFPAGHYRAEILYNYPVLHIQSSKLLTLATVSAIGGRNLFLGVAYLLVGSLMLLAAFIFCVLRCTTCCRQRFEYRHRGDVTVVAKKSLTTNANEVVQVDRVDLLVDQRVL